MQIVINIDNVTYDRMKTIIESDNFHYRDIGGVAMKTILNGTPVPENHGRLIDADAYFTSVKKHYFDNATVMRCTEIAVSNAPTIIEADTESEANNAEVN